MIHREENPPSTLSKKFDAEVPMKKLITLLVLAMALVALTATLATAEDKAPVAEEVDHAAKLAEMDGKAIYKGLCKTCHGTDADAGEYTPMSLIMEQWDEFFADTFVETHQEVACPKDETQMITEVLTEDALKKVQKFCVDHAADSEQPMTCG